MEHKKLIIGVLVILLVAGVAGVSASALDASSAHSRSLKELAQGVPVWQQVNSNGFGDPKTGEVSALEAFNGYLYAGTFNPIDPAPGQLYDGAQIFRSADGVNWNPVTDPGFGNTHDTAPPAILDFTVFKGYLFASTGRGNAAQIWRSVDGVNWGRVVNAGFGDPDIVDLTAMAEYDGWLYVGARKQDSEAQIWRTFTGDGNLSNWEQVVVGTDPAGVTGLAVFDVDGGLYAVVESETGAPAKIWRSYGGALGSWETVVSDGFGDVNTSYTSGMAVFGGYLYVGAGNTVVGAQLWRSNDGANWAQVITPGFGDANNQKVEMVYVFQNQLYVSVKNTATGMKLWRSTDGASWERANLDGFGDSNNSGTNWSNATADFLGQLYVGTSNAVDGGELWRMQQPYGVDLSINKMRQDSGTVVAGGRITYTIAITNAGPTTPVSATVVDTWTPVNAVVGVDAPGCAVGLGGGVITCTRTHLGTGSVLLPDPCIVFTTSATFSGTLINTASVTVADGIIDVNPDNNVTAPVLVTVWAGEIPPTPQTDLSISKMRHGSGTVAAGERITYTISVANAGPTTPVSATVVDTWTPVNAVVGVDAPGCSVNLGSAVITCTSTNLGTGSTLLPDPYVIITTNAAFSGTLTNTASVATTGGVADTDPDNNVSHPVVVTITSSFHHSIYLPIVTKVVAESRLGQSIKE